MFRWIAFILCIALILFSSLTVLHAPTLFTWEAAIGADEFGHFFIALSLFLFIFSVLPKNRAHRTSWITAILAIISLVCLLRPLTSAICLSYQLNSNLINAFDESASVSDVIKWKDLFKIGIKNKIVPENYIYSRSRSTNATTLDFYRAVNHSSTKAPCIVTIHGGSWHGGDKMQLPDINSVLANKGYAVASIDYRLAPIYKWPAQKEDVSLALEYLKTNAEMLGIDPTKFVLLGRSAGAQIASSVAYTLEDQSIRGVISLYGPQDMKFAWDHASSSDVLDTYSLFKDYIGGSPSEFPNEYKQTSAIMNISAKSPPTLLIHGNLDTLVWYKQSDRMNISLTKANVPHYYLALPWATHGFDYNLNGPGGQLEQACIDGFLHYAFKTPR
jgi:acetyl esterase/lipase